MWTKKIYVLEVSMSNDDKNIREKITYEEGEDATEYGEFISSYFAWVPLSKQKEIVNKLENITKDKNK